MLSDNFVTSAKFIASGMKWETSEPDSPKGVNSCEIYFTTVLNTLCKPFPMLCHNLISTEMLEDIRDGSQTHPNVNRREARYKIHDRIRQRQSEWKGALKAT